MSATDSFGLPQSRRWTDWQERSELLERLPAALCVCDAAGAIVDYNRRAAALWGREPRRGDGGETYCGFAAVIGAEGVALPRREWPMAQVLESGAAISDFEFLAERSDPREHYASLRR
jgi:PAS domain-containing protein